MPKRVMLIRHGRTAWNAERRYMGHSDVDLDDVGRAQAARLRERLKPDRIDGIYSSDSRRAFDFASMVFAPKPVVKLRELREMDFGIFEGMTHEEIAGRYPEEYDRWLRDIHVSAAPGGESMSDLKKRVMAAFHRLTSSGSGDLAIVTHAGPIRTIISGIAHSPDFWDVTPAVAGVSIIEFAGDEARVVLANDTSHL